MQNFYLRYCGYTMIVYFGLAFVIALMGTLPIQADYSNVEPPAYAGLLLKIALVVAPVFPSLLFLRDHRRAPSRKETGKFTGGIFVIFVALSTLFLLFNKASIQAFMKDPAYWTTFLWPQIVVLMAQIIVIVSVFALLPRAVIFIRKKGNQDR